LNPTNAVSRINVAILRVFLNPVYQRMQNYSDYAIQNKAGFYFGSTRIVIVAHRSANEKVSAGRLGSPEFPDLLF